MTDTQQMQKTILEPQVHTPKTVCTKFLFHFIKRTHDILRNLDTLIQTDRTQINRPGSRGSLTRGRPPQQNMITNLCQLLQKAILSYFQNGKLKCPLAFYLLINLFKSLGVN